MIFTKDETLEDILPQILLGEKTVTQIQNHPTIKPRKVSIQAIYKALRKLVTENVLVKHRRFYVTSREWINKIQKLQLESPVFIPEEGNTIQFTFSSFSQVDAYWKHAIFNLPKEDLGVPFYAYLPHNFWILNPERFESEVQYYADFETNRKAGFVVIGENTKADADAKLQLQNKFLRINTINYPRLRRTKHIAIMGRFITTTTLTPITARMIDMLYANYSEEDLFLKLKKMFEKKTTIKVMLENSESKARTLRKMLGKDFYIPKRNDV